MKKYFLLASFLGATLTMSAQSFAGGTGTTEDPYQVATAEQLQAVTDFTTSNFIQTADIDLEGVAFNPIATFTGVYDGGGHFIDNYTIESGSDGAGLFARLNTPGVIKNVKMRYAYIVGGNWSGILCSTNGNWEVLGGNIENCEIYDSSIEAMGNVGAFAGVAAGNFIGCRAFNVTVEGTETVGGISGNNEGGGRYKDCSFHGSVIGSANTGGICAFYNGACKWDYAFENCVVYGSVSSSSGTIGGVLGQPNWNCENAHITNCAVFADCSGQCVGSFGGNALRGKLTNSYATGNVKATGQWTHDVYTDNWNGGLCSVNFNGPIENCYFSGVITGTDDVKTAGICGRNWPGITVSHTYYNSDGAPMGMGDGDDPTNYDTKDLLPEEMLVLSNFKFSDMSKWQIAEGTTPFFANQTAPLKITECTTAKIAGTGEADLDFVYIYGSLSETITKPVTISNGAWSVELADGDAVESETVTVIGIGKNKMPSMVTKAKVGEATGITSATANTVKTVKAIYNVAGQRVNGIQRGQVNIVKYADGTSVKVTGK